MSLLLKPAVVVSFLAFLICFLVQVREHMHKFYTKATTQAISYNDQSLTFPAITICVQNGFKIDVMKEELNLPRLYWQASSMARNDSELWKPPKSLEEAELWWNKSTYSKEEVIQSAEFFQKYGSVDLNISEMNGNSYGRCYMTETTHVKSPGTFIFIKLKVPSRSKRLKIFIHEEEDADMLITGNYPLNSFRDYALERGMLLGILVTKSITFLDRENRSCQDKIQDCIMEKVRQDLPCYLPTIQNFGKGKKPCQNFSEASQADLISLLIAREVEDGQCGSKCETSNYDFRKLILPEPTHIGFNIGDRAGGDYATFYLRYSTFVVEESREVLLYDLNSIVSAVGGSLGLFLGFSCFGTAVDLLTWLSNKISKRRKP